MLGVAVVLILRGGRQTDGPIHDNEPPMTFDAWLAILADDEPPDIDAGAAEILREIREHGES